MNAHDSNVFTHSPFDRAIKRRMGDPMNDSQVAIEALIVAEDLSVVFQPIIRLSTGEVFAYEALTRCAVRPYRNPTALFERAADSGCCGRLGRMVREIAVPLCSGVPVFLNVHPRELEDRWIVRPDDPVFAHDRTVYIEVTESVPLMHFDLCRSVLRELRQRTDARLVIDDLGAGFSNLKLITELEPDVVKLDRSLVMGLDKSGRRRVLVEMIVSLCSRLGSQVVAEGIETQEELEVVRKCGVQFGQGFLFAHPGFPLPLRSRLEHTRRTTSPPAMRSPPPPPPPPLSRKCEPFSEPRPWPDERDLEEDGGE